MSMRHPGRHHRDLLSRPPSFAPASTITTLVTCRPSIKSQGKYEVGRTPRGTDCLVHPHRPQSQARSTGSAADVALPGRESASAWLVKVWRRASTGFLLAGARGAPSALVHIKSHCRTRDEVSAEQCCLLWQPLDTPAAGFGHRRNCIL